MKQIHYSFNDYYELAKEYYEQNGNLYVYCNLIVEKNGNKYRLGSFIHHQRDRYFKNLLPKDQIKMLEDIGMIWDIYDYRWNKTYQVLKDYCAKGHDANVPISVVLEVDGNKVNLGSWINMNRSKYLDNKLNPKYISLLEELGIKWRINSDWNDVYQAAKAYYDQHNNLLLPRDYYVEIDGKMVNISGWLHNQRRFFREGSLSKERIELLSKIGFFDDKQALKEEKMYELLTKYYQKHGNIDVPLDYSIQEGCRIYYLGRWLLTKRRKYSNGLLSSLEIERLKSLSFVFPAYYGWDVMYNLAKEYYRQHGNLRIPRDYKVLVDKESRSVGSWVATQRCYYKAGLLSEQQIALLEEIGIEWSIYRSHASWDEAYQHAKKYYETYGNLHVSLTKCQRIGIEFGLLSWVQNQIANYRKGKLSEEHKKLLENLGINWNYYDPEFYKMCAVLRDCLIKNKVYNMPENYVYSYDGVEYEIGKWLFTQKKAYKNKELKTKQVYCLRQNDLIWIVSNEPLWSYAYNHAKAFYQENHHLNFTDEYISKMSGIDLREWLKEMQQALVDGTLSSDKVLCLKKIGLSYSSKESYWMAMFNKAKELANLDFDINHLNEYEFFSSFKDVHTWLVYQRSIYSSLSPLKIALLESIGFFFNLRDGNWETMFSLAEKFIRENPQKKICYGQKIMYKKRLINIGGWIITQKNNYRKGKLHPDKIKRLASIGIVLDMSNNEELANICLEYGIDYEKNKKVINLNTKDLLLGKILWLLDNDMKLFVNNKLHPIFGMCDMNIQAIYHVSQEEIIRKYQEIIQKRFVLTNGKSE